MRKLNVSCVRSSCYIIDTPQVQCCYLFIYICFVTRLPELHRAFLMCNICLHGLSTNRKRLALHMFFLNMNVNYEPSEPFALNLSAAIIHARLNTL